MTLRGRDQQQRVAWLANHQSGASWARKWIRGQSTEEWPRARRPTGGKWPTGFRACLGPDVGQSRFLPGLESGIDAGTKGLQQRLDPTWTPGLSILIWSGDRSWALAILEGNPSGRHRVPARLTEGSRVPRLGIQDSEGGQAVCIPQSRLGRWESGAGQVDEGKCPSWVAWTNFSQIPVYRVASAAITLLAWEPAVSCIASGKSAPD